MLSTTLESTYQIDVQLAYLLANVGTVRLDYHPQATHTYKASLDNTEGRVNGFGHNLTLAIKQMIETAELQDYFYEQKKRFVVASDKGKWQVLKWDETFTSTTKWCDCECDDVAMIIASSLNKPA